MKRCRIQLADIAAFDNLMLAAWKAACGKRHRPDVIFFTSQLDQHLNQLAQAILQGSVPYGHYREFYIHDPKKRLIHAACFEDRVLHHAIMNLAEPVFQRTLVPSTYACRPGMGIHRAITQVQTNLRRYLWYVKVDIAGYFPNIDHNILFSLLQRRFKGDEFMHLLWRIIDSYHAQCDKGLPIGSLTSQYFANYYLDGADRFLLEHPKIQAHVRYMDDILFWCTGKQDARQLLAALRDYLYSRRQLQIKPDTQINRSVCGVTYCGYRVLPGIILLTQRKRQRYRQLRQQWENAWRDGKISELELQQAYSSVHAITLHTDGLAWRKRNLQLHPPLAIE